MTQTYKSRGLYIDGEWIPTDKHDAIINPATLEMIGEAPVGGRAHVEDALAAARHAFDKGPWPRMLQAERQAVLSAFLDEIERRAQEIINLIVAEAGSTISLAEYHQYGTPVRHARHSVAISSRPAVEPLFVDSFPNGTGGRTLGAGALSREPVGVVSAITPYNFPFFLNLGKIIPAMAVGCTVILKPSPYTPFEALIFGEIAEAVGLPNGVLNVVTGGMDVGEALTTDPRVDLVTFTGSDTVGAAIQAQSAPTLKRLLLELGGKSALIVRSDADLDKATSNGLAGFITHCGQGCGLLTRHLVHNSIRKDYVDMITRKIDAIKVGNPADRSVGMGPLIREAARARSEKYTDIALQEGATLVTGGGRPSEAGAGFFYKPTLFDNVKNSFRVAQEEIFGPIAVVIGFEDDEEAVALANDSEFGLAGAIFSRDVGGAYEMALRIRTGAVALNGGAGRMSSQAPFGGIKRSGYGREYGMEGLNEFTYMKNIHFHAE
ncbi:aldehyde dehydrogenase [Sphingobium sp. SCG-1]|uniref:aldehyde dehydrogenase family protein n=1 Tax=Sphingobium sp. SCG-1 TaxID=2072936 RepID=UPI000CD6C071|nr:aldehyde dehydrogenase family protein [Sphingobium sp. SCG-1]AUW57108.1 aldehyde dehydrogenase [Sphingobium sp. SCG-1]